MTVKQPKDGTINITVKAHQLYPLSPTETNVDEYSYLLDDDGFESRYGVSNKNYETGVYLNKKITWNIEAADKNGADREYDVELVSVTHNSKTGNPNFFDNETLVPTGNNKKKITGTVVNAPLLPDIDDNYTIHFTISHNSRVNPFPLDPKLKIKQT